MSAITTMKSEEARVRMRDILDEVIAGGEVVIERYAKPTAVVIGYNQWQQLQKTTDELARLRRVIEADKQFAEMDAGNVVEFDFSQAPA